MEKVERFMLVTPYSIRHIVIVIMFSGMMAMLCGCSGNVATVYSSEYISYSGSDGVLNTACQNAITALTTGDEGDQAVLSESTKVVKSEEKVKMSKFVIKAKFKGYDYNYTKLKLGDNDLILILETTDPDQGKMLNAFSQEFIRHNIKIK